MNTSLAASRIRCVITVSALAVAGCAESSFVLAPDSRLPAWFEIPRGRTRGELTVTMDYYVHATGSEAKFKLFDSRGQQLMAKAGTFQGSAPILLRNTPAGSHYPSYELITVGGVVDVIEHRAMEPVFHITDDAAIRKELGVKQ